ncbi:MAG: hypothetical protein J2P18_10470 [Nocardia sp.]|nr:hypothetical protein [Nocardia sp.]
MSKIDNRTGRVIVGVAIAAFITAVPSTVVAAAQAATPTAAAADIARPGGGHDGPGGHNGPGGPGGHNDHRGPGGPGGHNGPHDGFPGGPHGPGRPDGPHHHPHFPGVPNQGWDGYPYAVPPSWFGSS